MTDSKKHLEEKLREASCFGDLDTVKELLSSGVNVNSQNEMNGWSALHWAAHRNFQAIVEILLKHGADKNCVNNMGKTPYQLSTDLNIQVLLGGSPHNVDEKELPIMPGYLKNPPLYIPKNFTPSSITKEHQSTNNIVGNSADELVLKVRLADSEDVDFIEVEIQRNELSFRRLVETCSEELNILPSSIARIRKLPNTRLRKDKDVWRLENFQEIEIVLEKMANASNLIASSASSPTLSIMRNCNQYESISLKKDQTVLY